MEHTSWKHNKEFLRESKIPSTLRNLNVRYRAHKVLPHQFQSTSPRALRIPPSRLTAFNLGPEISSKISKKRRQTAYIERR